jgi:hypothetical protein
MSKLNGQWIEAFRAGSYGEKGTYTEADIDKIVASYNPANHEAPVVLGHPKDNAPAYGWVEAAKRVGATLMLKLKQVQPAFEQLVESGAFKKRSISLYSGADGALSLRHVGFLGAMPPHVKGLKDIALCEFDDKGKAQHEFVFESQFQEEEPTMDEKTLRTMFSEMLDGFAKKMGLKEPDGALSPEKQKEFDDLKKKADDGAAALLKLKNFEDADKRKAAAGRVETAISKLKSANKWLPSFDKLGMNELFSALGEDTVELEFSDSKGTKVKKTSLDILASFMESLPKMIPTVTVTTRTEAPVGRVVPFTEPKGSTAEVTGMDVAELAETYFQEGDKKVAYAQCLSRARREIAAKATASAGAV